MSSNCFRPERTIKSQLFSFFAIKQKCALPFEYIARFTVVRVSFCSRVFYNFWHRVSSKKRNNKIKVIYYHLKDTFQNDQTCLFLSRVYLNFDAISSLENHFPKQWPKVLQKLRRQKKAVLGSKIMYGFQIIYFLNFCGLPRLPH